MTPSDKPEAEPLPISVLDLHDGERRENGEVVQLQPDDRAMIRYAREDEWEQPVIEPHVHRPMTEEDWSKLKLHIWRFY